MKRFSRFLLGLALVAAPSLASAQGGYIASDRFGYNGTITTIR